MLCDDDEADVVDRMWMCRSNHFLMRIRTFVSWRLSETFGMNILTLYPKSKTPYNVTVYKGSNQAALTRAFVLYFLYRCSSRPLVAVRCCTVYLMSLFTYVVGCVAQW